MKPENVFIDVQPWILEIHKQLPNATVPMCGIFRHAELLCKHFQPARVLMPGEDVMREATALLNGFLGKMVTHICPDLENGLAHSINHANCRAWISLAPDCCGPATFEGSFPGEKQYQVLTILHDTQALVRDFGPENRQNFVRSIGNTDAFLPVSGTAFAQLKAAWHHSKIPQPRSEVKFIGYGNTHGFEVMPKRDFLMRSVLNVFPTKSALSVSVSGIYPHKNLGGIADVVTKLGTAHLHVGRFIQPNEEEMIACIDAGMLFIGGMTDAVTRLYMTAADVFICLSKDEGFSIPPMEACLLGCSRFILSDIPAHREIYGEFDGVVFVDPNNPTFELSECSWEDVMDIPEVDSEMRKELFQKYHPDNVLSGLRAFLGLDS